MSLKSNRALVGSIAAALALTTAACSSGEPTAKAEGDVPTVRFQGLPADPDTIPMLVMQEHGLDEKYGFAAELVEVEPDAATNTLLLGESDIAMEQDAIAMTHAQAEGHDAVVFYPVLNTMVGVVVAEDSPYQTPEDLIGKKVGHFGVDSGTTAIIGTMLKKLYDIDVFEDYDLVETGPSALPELLKTGRVDAIFNYEPLALRAVLETPGRYLFEPAKAWAEEEDGWSPPLTFLAARTEWLEENTDLAINVRKAWAEAIEIIEESNYELVAEEPYRAYLDMRTEEELDAFIEYCAALPCFLNSWTEQDKDKLNGWLELMADNDVLIEETAEKPVAIFLEDLKG